MKPLDPSFVKFLSDLSQHNTAAWFNENRKTYEREVKKPFTDFVEDMILRIRQHDPEVQIKAADAITRINKDTRFSKDKTPYHTFVAANISACGKKDKAYPGFYFRLSPEGISLYGGVYTVENDMLQRIRHLIAGNPDDFSAAYHRNAFREKFGIIRGERHKRLPEPFQSMAEKEPLIAYKQFYYTATLSPELITSAQLPDTLMEYYLAGKPLNDFLKKAWHSLPPA